MKHAIRRLTRPLLFALLAATASACCWHPHFGHGFGHGHSYGHHYSHRCR
ncbi:MAG: hypothetical protein U1E73_13100 [Planctomycetota bacterium]